MNRDEFLNAVRAAVHAAAPYGYDEREPIAGEVGRVQVGEGALADLFARRAEDSGMHVHRVSSMRQAGEKIAALLREEGMGRVLAWNTPLMDELDFGAAEVERWDPAVPEEERKAQAFAADCGITGVDYAVAETGSLVLCSAPEQGRSVSLLGRVHIAVVRAEQILPDLYDLFSRLMQDYPDGIPSNITLITGPSKTADIELTLVVGVHGPGAVHVVLVEP